MKTSTVGVRKIKKWEELALTAYPDIAGVWTNGYGHTGPDVREGQVITEVQAEQWLREDLREAETCINARVKVPLTQAQFDALVSFTFNVGCGAFASSTLLKRLNAGQYGDVPNQMARWNKAKINGKLQVSAGLVNRRAVEIALWGSSFADTRTTTRPAPAEPKKVTESATMQGAAMASAGIMGEELSRTAQDLSLYAEAMEWVKVACMVLSVLGLCFVVYGRLRLMRDENV